MKLFIEVVDGAEGPSLNIMNEGGGYRLAGPKAWGGGTVLYKFAVNPEELIREVNNLLNEADIDE